MKMSKTASDIIHNSEVLKLRKWSLLDIEIELPSQSKKLEKAARAAQVGNSSHGQCNDDSDSEDMEEVADVAALEPEYDFELPSAANTTTQTGLKSSSE